MAGEWWHGEEGKAKHGVQSLRIRAAGDNQAE